MLDFETVPLSITEKIHLRALDLARNYKRGEAELIEAIQEVDEKSVYLKRGHSSLFQYVIRELQLSESVACNLISVARKAREIPALREGLKSGVLSLSNARKIIPVLTIENQKEWIEKAGNLSHRQLEKEIVKIRPEEKTFEKVSYVTSERIELRVGLSEREILKLRRAQDLMSQAKRRAVSLEETIESLTKEYLRRFDPLEKAKRHHARKGAPTPAKNLSSASKKESPTKLVDKPVALQVTASQKKTHIRQPIPATLVHTVNLRDGRKCTYTLSNGKRCNQSRWIEIHHLKPVSNGGENTLENLTTLCSAHHRFLHSNSNSNDKLERQT